MDIVRQGEGSGVEKEVVENMRHQLQLLSQVLWNKLTFINEAVKRNRNDTCRITVKLSQEPKSDQHQIQISPHNINTQSRINEVITYM